MSWYQRNYFKSKKINFKFLILVFAIFIFLLFIENNKKDLAYCSFISRYPLTPSNTWPKIYYFNINDNLITQPLLDAILLQFIKQSQFTSINMCDLKPFGVTQNDLRNPKNWFNHTHVRYENIYVNTVLDNCGLSNCRWFNYFGTSSNLNRLMDNLNIETFKKNSGKSQLITHNLQLINLNCIDYKYNSNFNTFLYKNEKYILGKTLFLG